jgi:hypothetical protein
MKKVFSAVLALGFLFAISTSALAQSATDLNGIKISGTVQLLYGATGKVNKGEMINNTTPYDYGVAPTQYNGAYTTKSQGEYLADLWVIKTFENGASASIRLRASNNDAGQLALGNFRSNVNDNVGPYDTTGNTPQDNLFIKDAYFTLPFAAPALGKVVLTIGKTANPTSANSVASSVGSFFTDDATIWGVQGAGTRPYGVKVDITPISLVTLTYGYFAQNISDTKVPNSVGDGNYHVAQINVKPIAGGNYRFGYWEAADAQMQTRWYKTNIKSSDEAIVYERYENGQFEYYYRAGNTENPRGLFLSFDQTIGNLGFFARVGKRIDSTVAGGFGLAGQDFQIGTKVGGTLWGRSSDSLFLGVGMAWAQDDVLTAGNEVFYGERSTNNSNGTVSGKEESEKIKPEGHLELNYAYSLTSGVTITPFFQYVWDIYTGPTSYEGSNGNTHFNAASVKDYGYAGGVRFTLNF